MTSKQFNTSLSIIHAALLMGQLGFGAIVFVINQQSSSALGEGMDESAQVFMYVIPLIVIAGLGAAIFVPRMRLPALRQEKQLSNKLMGYRSLMIVKYALMEGQSILSLIAFLITGKMFFIGLAGLVVVLFLFERPTTNKLLTDLDLSGADKNTFEDPNAQVL